MSQSSPTNRYSVADYHFFGGNTWWQIAHPAANKLPPFLQQCRAGLPAKSCTVIWHIYQQVGGSPLPPFTEQLKRRKSLWIILNNYFDFSDILVFILLRHSWCIDAILIYFTWFGRSFVLMRCLDHLSKVFVRENALKKCDRSQKYSWGTWKPRTSNYIKRTFSVIYSLLWKILFNYTKCVCCST